MSPDFLTLTDAAQLIPGANVNTLKRRARQGKLTVYRTGRSWFTTRDGVRYDEPVEAD